MVHVVSSQESKSNDIELRDILSFSQVNAFFLQTCQSKCVYLRATPYSPLK